MKKKRALLFVVSAPSGAGKTSLCREVANVLPDLYYSVSWTTRVARTGEVHGKDYFFVDTGKFQEFIQQGKFSEWAEVHGKLYGTHEESVRGKLEEGIDVIVDVDTQGANLLKKRFPDGVYIYILPPSLNTLRKRLYDRNSDAPEEIERRLNEARREIQDLDRYSYLVINDKFEKAKHELGAVILAERIKLRPAQTDWIKKTLLEDQPLTRKKG